MDPQCSYHRFGCKTKLSSEDHALAHSRDSVSNHLNLVVQAFDQEAERNKLLSAKLDLLHKWLKEHDDKIKGMLPPCCCSDNDSHTSSGINDKTTHDRGSNITGTLLPPSFTQHVLMLYNRTWYLLLLDFILWLL